MASFPLRILLFFAAASGLWAASGDHGGLIPYLFALVGILLAAKVGGEVFERLGLPAVLGELLTGMILGNLHLAGIDWAEPLKQMRAMEAIAEVGVILLLFEVGLESHMRDLLAVGSSAMLVAALGVVMPIGLGYGVSAFFLNDAAWYVHLFVGATLAATSVGITARVLRDLKKMDTKEAKIILGAAVVDDVLGLVILAIVTGLVSSIGAGGEATIAAGPLLFIIGKAVAFLAGAIIVGRFVHVRLVRVGSRFRVPGMALVIAITHCFTLAALAAVMGLDPIVGAFAAGLVLEESDYEEFHRRGSLTVEELVRPLSTLLIPVFFVSMGLKVDFAAFASWKVIAFAAALTVAAIAGKQVCALGVLEKGLNRGVVGIGMIPRGEVGLIFTGIGASLVVFQRPILSAETVSALVVMVVLTTVMTPPLLKIFFARGAR
ncbi:MAG: cation:proton antiporter [Bryobacterales bacterium]|nr:cation:proton antiporter [Bryobacterales bacterium]